jgi:hypothetical protein
VVGFVSYLSGENMTTNLVNVQQNSENQPKEHTMKYNTYLFFNDQCAAAFKLEQG